MTITDFLLARIAEDEAVAQDALERGFGGWEEFADRGANYEERTHITRQHPARVLAQCAAMRAIVELHEVYGHKRGSCGTCTDSDYLGLVDEGPCPTLRALASVYADQPDYNEACSLLDGWEWDR